MHQRAHFKKTDPQTEIYYASRGRAFGLFLVCAVVISQWRLLLSIHGDNVSVENAKLLVFFICAYLVVIGLENLLRLIFPSSCSLEIGPQGVGLRRIGFMQRYSWDEIDSFGVRCTNIFRGGTVYRVYLQRIGSSRFISFCDKFDWNNDELAFYLDQKKRQFENNNLPSASTPSSAAGTIFIKLSTPLAEEDLPMMKIIHDENPDIEKIFVTQNRDEVHFTLKSESNKTDHDIIKILKGFGVAGLEESSSADQNYPINKSRRNTPIIIVVFSLLLILTMISHLTHIFGRLSAKDVAPNAVANRQYAGITSESDFGCVNSRQISNQYTPMDLFSASAKCLRDNNYDDAAFLYILGQAYGRFDALRIADKTSDATLIMMISIGNNLNKQQKTLFAEKLKQSEIPEKHTILCRTITRIGPPIYYPSDTIGHGRQQLDPNFDAKTAWSTTLHDFMHCP